ncbi:MAG: type IV pilus biogenesis protein PilM [Mariniblastus sp.]
MAFVALQFEDNQILVASSRAAGKRLQIQHLFSVELNSDDASAGESLKAELSSHGLSRSEAILVVSRANVEMREVTVPPAPDNELPDMVRFIARSEFASLNENWILDYVPLSNDPSMSRTVLAAGLSPELEKQMRSIAELAGLKVKHIVLRPYACIDLIRTTLADGKCRLLVDPNGDQTDMTIVSGTDLLATRTVRIPEAYDANKRSTTLISEVRRTLASSRKMLGDRNVTNVIMYGRENKALEGNLAGQLDLEVEFVDPMSLAPIASGVKVPVDDSRYAALLGSLVQSSAGKQHAIDFVNPRKPIVKKLDLKKWYLYGGLALAASLMAIVVGWTVLSNQSSEVKELQDRLQELERQNKGLAMGSVSAEQVEGEVNAIDEWKMADVNWLEQLYRYSENSLTADDVIVDVWEGRTTRGVSEIVVKTRMQGVEQDSDLVNALENAVAKVAKEESAEVKDGEEANVKAFSIVKPERTVLDPEAKDYPFTGNLTLTLERDTEALLEEINLKADPSNQNKNAEE